jgi:plastocyanin
MGPARTTLAVVLLLGCAARARTQDRELPAAMERLAEAVGALERAVDAGDRAEYAAPLTAIAGVSRRLRAAGDEPARTAALDEIDAAVALMHKPVGDGRHSDPWDLARLRKGCTACHVQLRSRNEERGMFPNRGNLVTGRIELFERDGRSHANAADVVVFLEPRQPEPAAPRPRPAAISQRGRRFDPSVLVVTVGSTVLFPNDDLVFHNVFSLSRGNHFDLGTYGQGVSRQQTFATPGLVKVHCNIHPEMAAHVLVLHTSLHAVTAADGFWLIPDVPDGAYTLRVWQPLAAEQRQDIDLTGGVIHTVPLTVRETKPRVQHNDKHGRPYQKDY